MESQNNRIEFWTDLNPKLKASILRGLDQSDKGIGENHEDVMKRIRRKIKK